MFATLHSSPWALVGHRHRLRYDRLLDRPHRLLLAKFRI
jgi:hypothetical protein